MSTKDIFENLRYEQEINRLTKKAKDKGLDGEVKIGKRNPKDGTFQAIRSNKKIEKGVKTSNGGTKEGQIVRGIQADNLWALDWKNAVESKNATSKKKTSINFVFLYSKVEVFEGKQTRVFYVAGNFKPIKIPELNCPESWIFTGYINLTKKGWFVDILYAEPLLDPTNNFLSYNEETAYLIQYDGTTKSFKKITGQGLLGLHYIGNSIWWGLPSRCIYDWNLIYDNDGGGTGAIVPRIHRFVPTTGTWSLVKYPVPGSTDRQRSTSSATSSLFANSLEKRNLTQHEIEGVFTYTRTTDVLFGGSVLDYVTDIKTNVTYPLPDGTMVQGMTDFHASSPNDLQYRDKGLVTKPLIISSDGKSAIFCKKDYQRIQVALNAFTTLNENTFYYHKNYGTSKKQISTFPSIDLTSCAEIFGNVSSGGYFNTFGFGHGATMLLFPIDELTIIGSASPSIGGGFAVFPNLITSSVSSTEPIDLAKYRSVSWHGDRFFAPASPIDLWGANKIENLFINSWQIDKTDGLQKITKQQKPIKIKCHKIKKENKVIILSASYCP